MNERIKILPNLKLVFISLFFSVFLFGMLSFHMFCRVNEKFETVTFLILCLFLILLVSTSLFAMSFFSNIIINENEININKLLSKRTLKFKDIKSTTISEIVELNGALVDRTQINLINGDIVNLYSFKYKNFYHLKIILNHINELSNVENFKIKKLNFNTKESKRKDCKIDKGKTYNFSHILSFSGLALYSLVFIISYNLLKSENIKINDIVQSIFLISIFFLIFSYNTNYFVITKDFLIIKNSLRFWEKKYFELEQIESVNLEKYYRQISKTIIIKTKNFESISISSDNLLSRDWNLLKNELKRNEISVYDNSSVLTRKVLY